MAAEAAAKKMVTLRSSDGKEFEVKEETIAAASATIKNVLDDDCAGVIPVPVVTGCILARVLEYCDRHFADPDDAAAADPFLTLGVGAGSDPALERFDADFIGAGSDPALERFDADFIGAVDQDTLFDLMLAANFLGVQPLLDLACKTVADQMRGKSVEQMRAHFGVVNDYTKEEEDEVRSEIRWAFE